MWPDAGVCVGGRACVHILSYVFINLFEHFLYSRFPEQFCSFACYIDAM